MRTLFDVLLSWAVTLSGYPMPEYPPAVVALPPEDLHRRVCGEVRPCAVVAMLAPSRDVVLIDERLDIENDTEVQALVVHEFVHYLQYLDGRMDDEAMNCEARMTLEREAYLVQARFAAEHGTASSAAATAISLLPRVCAEPDAVLDHFPHPAIGNPAATPRSAAEPEFKKP